MLVAFIVLGTVAAGLVVGEVAARIRVAWYRRRGR